MEKNIAAPLTEAEQTAVQMQLIELLRIQTNKYTGGESSSVPMELAQELMNAICCTLRISLQPQDNWRILLHTDAEKLFRQRQEEICRITAETQKLWQKICLAPFAVQSIALRDTLRSIGGFFKAYDRYYFAHRIPCEIDYQLAVPVSEDLKGIFYVAQWLRQFAIEQQFLLSFTPLTEHLLLKRYSPEYEELIDNLFEPVFINAVGLQLLGKLSKRNLLFRAEQVAELDGMTEYWDKHTLHCRFTAAAEQLAAAIGMQAPVSCAYFSECAARLAERVLALRGTEGMYGVFL